MDKTTIIVVEDNIVYCEFVCNMLAREGYRTVKAYHLSTAKKHLQQATDNDIVVADLRLPDGNGIDLLRWMRKEGKMQPFIIMTDIASGGLRLRSQASTSSDILSTAHNGDNVVVIRQVGDWYLVNYNLKIGYMHSDYITFKERENIELGYGSVDPYLANIRSGPSTSSGLVDQAGSGAKVFIFGFNCGWYKVKYNGQIGYIRSDLVTLLEKPYCNSGSSSSGSSYSSATGYDDSYSSGSSSSSSTSLGTQIANYGMSFVGYPYVYGGTSPSGFDCSGFVQYIYRQFGYSINRTATAQLANGYYVSYDSLIPGDLVFFGSGSSASHVGMYIGGGEFVHAANSRSGVKISSLSESWYAARYIGARRIVG